MVPALQTLGLLVCRQGVEDSGMNDQEAKRVAERVVSAIENHFRDWLMPGEYHEAVELVAEVLKRETKQ